MKIEFLKQAGEIVFKDQDGNTWDAEGVAGAFEALADLKKALNAVNYYAPDDEDDPKNEKEED